MRFLAAPPQHQHKVSARKRYQNEYALPRFSKVWYSPFRKTHLSLFERQVGRSLKNVLLLDQQSPFLRRCSPSSIFVRSALCSSPDIFTHSLWEVGHVLCSSNGYCVNYLLGLCCARFRDKSLVTRRTVPTKRCSFNATASNFPHACDLIDRQSTTQWVTLLHIRSWFLSTRCLLYHGCSMKYIPYNLK